MDRSIQFIAGFTRNCDAVETPHADLHVGWRSNTISVYLAIYQWRLAASNKQFIQTLAK